MTDPIGSESLHHPLGRRRFMAALAGGLLAGPLAVEAQRAARSYRIGILDPGNPPTGPGPTYIAFRNRLAELGRVIQIEARYADGQPERLPGLAADLVRLNVDLLVPIGSHATKAAKDATTTVPIVFFGVSSPVAAGVVASLARPGANVTGATDQLGDLQGKLLQLVSETVPHGSRIGMLTDFSNPSSTAGGRAHFARIAQERGLAVIWADVRRPEDLDAAFATLSRGPRRGAHRGGDAGPLARARSGGEVRRAQQAADDIARPGHGRGRLADALPPGNGGYMASGRRPGRSHFSGRQAGGSPCCTTDEVRADHQPQDGQGARADDPNGAARAGGPDHRVSRRRVGRSRRNDASTSPRRCLRVHSAL